MELLIRLGLGCKGSLMAPMPPTITFMTPPVVLFYRGGLALVSDNKDLIFNVQPVLMVIGLILMNGEDLFEGGSDGLVSPFPLARRCENIERSNKLKKTTEPKVIDLQAQVLTRKKSRVDFITDLKTEENNIRL
ncbi:hypothetical protein Tsubulata_008677 [Turnera subulata]|uniref:Uncharacterized protein n=1 Tax=Turnera subulata TaxID=218843 RepID=A0A9Q0F7H9_9ROSI|nr:hypothetical protein Tsubulata_008677 [Turnera subulata]